MMCVGAHGRDRYLALTGNDAPREGFPKPPESGPGRRASPAGCYEVDGILYALPEECLEGGVLSSTPSSEWPCLSYECACEDCRGDRSRLVTLGPSARNKAQPWHPRRPTRI
jgi:hypothetical protein